MLIKRWLALFMLSVTVTSLALAMALAWVYRSYDFPSPTQDLVRGLTLQFVPHPFREVIVLIAGVGLLATSFWGLSRSLIVPLMAGSPAGRDLVDIVAEHRFGPVRPELNVVTLGGGTGLSTLLRGLKHCDAGLTAIVTVADDGGSTGRIREEFNMPAPGDIRNCIVALADAESTVGRLFQYRFDQEGSQLDGHSFGNLFITALTQVTGSFEQAVIESGRVLAVRGRVLPSTLANVRLSAELIDGSVVHGESSIAHKQAPIKRVFLEPDAPDGYEPAFTAIINADLIVLGPGSLYTSVLPNLLVGGVVEAIRWSRGTVVYVCNVATQQGETDHFGAADHVRAIVSQLGPRTLHYALVNSNPAAAAAIAPELGVDAVLDVGLDALAREHGFTVVARDVVNDRNPLRHDPEKLAAALVEIARGVTVATTAAVDRVTDIRVFGDAQVPAVVGGSAPVSDYHAS
ncbi:MAG: FIG002813: LPPG:FO 2-phospho-L-lactate transferase like, CofD-like [uncultured Thermomicrobiales bacterium]|uniref:Putative gluconeogenesis factor n=1 Tax=uncultured Thermomicrobiales bacterium TaxID=1645740 RepID=A0A6J4TMD4_9BACT|nr:MAG: FIG002813: LPPG:FO 2-phospho-L-lactate transferase like, CofD-like [uncultured Thermomicrobiales bacterium]